MAPYLLDLFCGAGGAARGYQLAGFHVTGIDVRPMSRYAGDAFVQADALEFLAEHGHEFDVIHASPPCQSYLNLGGVNRSLGRTYDHPDLIGVTRDALVATGRPYVIENVMDAARVLRASLMLCGTSFGLPLRRHRLFESSVLLMGRACDHGRFTEPRYWTSWRPNGEQRLATTVQVYGQAGGTEHWPSAMGIDWMKLDELREAIPPAYTEYIGAHLRALLEQNVRSSDWR